jgi:esterase/lipase superfamily enzyme
MHREYHKWYSPSLNRDMELLIFGHAGARVLIFPTSKGRFFEWSDRGVMEAFREGLEKGWYQFFTVDSIDEESWYAYWAHPGGRAYRHHQYMEYIHNEVLPLSTWKNPNPFLMTVGASFGAFHAMSFGLKYPDKVDRIIGMSGLYEIRSFTGGYSDNFVYQYNPPEFIPNEHDPYRLERLRHVDIIIAGGKDDRLYGESQMMSTVLWNKGIGNALRSWSGWSHDWSYWVQMLNTYINGHD